MTKRVPFPLINALIFGLLSALIVFQPTAAATYHVLFEPNSNDLIQQPMPEEWPIPKTLVWGDTAYSFVTRLGGMTPGGSLLMGIGLSLAMLYFLLRILNPTFRLTTGVDWDSTVLSRTYMHTWPLIKAFLVLVFAAIPLFILWLMIGFVPLSAKLLTLTRMAAMGAGIWFLFSRDGVVGHYENGNYNLPRERKVLISLLARGAALGLACGVVLAYSPRVGPAYLIKFYASIGSIGEGQWWRIVCIVCGIGAGLGTAIGGLAVALGTHATSIKRRLLQLIPFALLLVGTVWLSNIKIPNLLRERYDYDAGIPYQRLAKMASIKIDPGSHQTIVLLNAYHPVAFSAEYQSIDQLDAQPEALARLEDFMNRRNYATSLSTPAFRTLFDGYAMQWNRDRLLDLEWRFLTRCPDANQIGVCLETLTICFQSATGLKWVNKLANSGQFTIEDRAAKVVIGDMYAHYGDSANAYKWYRKAEITESQAETRANERTLATNGVIAGRATLNGRTAANLMVGIVPLQATRDLSAMMPVAGWVKPFWLRWVGASTGTGKDGSFELNNLVEGRYLLVITSKDFPSTIRTVEVAGSPGPIILTRSRMHANVGKIELLVTEPVALKR